MGINAKVLESFEFLAKGILYFFGFCILSIVTIIVYCKLTYYDELYQIENDLNAIEGVEVLNIWGHDDISLEEIAARIHIEGKGELVLQSLSRDVFRYPHSIYIGEFNGISFVNFHCMDVSHIPDSERGIPGRDCVFGIGSSLDIGEESPFGKMLPNSIHIPEDLVKNYDHIEKIVASIPELPDMNQYFTHEGKEEYFIGKQHKKTVDQDPIFGLLGLDGLHEFSKTLDWRNRNCVN